MADQRGFRGLILGLHPTTVKRVLHLHGLSLRVDGYLPPLSLALGLAGRRMLDREASLGLGEQYEGRAVLTAWGGVALVFFLTLGSFVLDIWHSWRLPLLIATIVLGVAASAFTFILYRRKRGTLGLDTDDASIVPWDFVVSGELTLLVLALALVVLFFGFVLFFLWLPALLLLVNLLTFGELWRSYQTVSLSGEASEDQRMDRAATALLRGGGVLSRSWMLHLAPETRHRAGSLRRAHLRVHEGFLLLGVSSLTFATLFVASRILPAPSWAPVLLFLGVLTVIILLGVLWALNRRSRLRQSTLA